MGKQKRYTGKYKIEIVKKHLEEGRSLGNLAKEVGCDKSVISRWTNKYETEGEKGLLENKRGKAKINKGRPKSKFDSVEEELNYVKAERDVLKKFLEIQRRSIKK